MTRITSAAYVTAVLHLLQAYNAADLDGFEATLDPAVDWQGQSSYQGRSQVRAMLAELRARWTKPQVRPEDFREAGGHVLMIVSFHEGEPGLPPRALRQSWIADVNDDGLVSRVRTYESPAQANRALDALMPKVPA